MKNKYFIHFLISTIIIQTIVTHRTKRNDLSAIHECHYLSTFGLSLHFHLECLLLLIGQHIYPMIKLKLSSFLFCLTFVVLYDNITIPNSAHILHINTRLFGIILSYLLSMGKLRFLLLQI